VRFAVLPPRQPGASPRSHRMPCGDIPGRIHISVAGELAGCATEEGLALAALRCDVPARRAALAGECGADLLDPSGSFLLQTVHQQAPARAKDAPVQPGFLPDLPTRLFEGALRGSGHGRDLQVFDADHVEPPHDVRAYLLAPVLAAVSLPGLEFRDRRLYLPAPTRPALRSGQLALQPTQPVPLAPGEAGNTEQFAGGQGGGHHDAPVNTDDLTILRSKYRTGDRGESHVPAPRSVACHAVRLHVPRDRTRPAEPDPAGLRHPDLSGLAAEAAHMRRLDRDNPEPFIPLGLPPPRPAVCASEEACHRLREIPQRLLLHHLAPCAQPLMLRAGGGELPALLQVAGGTVPARTPPRFLLDREVPNVPGVRAVSQQDRFLFRGGGKAVSRHTNIISTERRKRRCLPALKGGVSTPRSR
jgi:hypothetical protein